MAIGEIKVTIKTTVRFKWLLLVMNAPFIVIGMKPLVPKWFIKHEIID